MVGSLGQDVRYGVRLLRTNPGFASIIVLTLALGIGANTAIFSVVNGVVLQPLDYQDPDGLYMIWQDRQARGGPPDEWAGRSLFSDWREDSHTFQGMAAVTGASFTLTGTDRAVALQGARVSPGYFRILGVSPAQGRGLLDEEEMPGRGNVVVLSYALWQERFGGDPGVVGRTISLDGEPYAVVAVAPAGFRPPINSARELWVPLEERVRRDLATPRFVTVLLAAFAAVALLLAAVGLYGVLAYSVSRRTREFGIRIAMGAESGDLLGGVMRRGLVLVGVGLALGLIAAFGVTRFLSSLLYGVSPTDPLTLAGVSLLLVAVGAAACWLPARRATRVDPMVAVRAE